LQFPGRNLCLSVRRQYVSIRRLTQRHIELFQPVPPPAEDRGIYPEFSGFP
jgi:hypothetical protein